MKKTKRSNEHSHQALIEQYLHLTNVVMPEHSRKTHIRWPVSENHCFQRIVLDAICEGVWHVFLASPAYKSMSKEQLTQAIELCNELLMNKQDIKKLNKQSLEWRKNEKAKQLSLDL